MSQVVPSFFQVVPSFSQVVPSFSSVVPVCLRSGRPFLTLFRAFPVLLFVPSTSITSEEGAE